MSFGRLEPALASFSGQLQIFNVNFRRFGVFLFFGGWGLGPLGGFSTIRREVPNGVVGCCLGKKVYTSGHYGFLGFRQKNINFFY